MSHSITPREFMRGAAGIACVLAVMCVPARSEERPSPICFWSFDTNRVRDDEWKPYIDPELQKGTTPLVKLMGGLPTRNFQNYYHYPGIADQDFAGPRAILDNRYKLVIDGGGTARELFDLRSDPAEERNLVETHSVIVQKLARQLREWQRSVLESLSGADYR